MKIWLRSGCKINGKVDYEGVEHDYRFFFKLSNRNVIETILYPEQGEIHSLATCIVSKRDIKNLNENIKKLPQKVKEKFSPITSSLLKSNRKVIGLIKFGLGCTSIGENLISNCSLSWSVDKKSWKDLPSGIHIEFSGMYSFHRLNKKSRSILQKSIQNGFEPFLAMKYIHHARNETNPNYKWIDATIAAELAIKEFLIRLKPENETLILEVPSPPLHKLYGKVLESFDFSKSPKLGVIQKGVEKRNDLVHRPLEIEITSKEANQYINDIEHAMCDLILKLYGNREDVAYFYEGKTLN